MELLAELWMFVNARKKYWLLPIIVIMLMLGVIIVLAKSSALAPLIYTMF